MITLSAAPIAIEGLISDLAFILILAAVTTIFFKLIRQPVVLGYIVAGFLASPNFTYLPSVTTEANIDFWAQIGIVVLLFSLGLEFSFKKLLNAGGSAVVTALIIVIGMMVAGFSIGHLMGFSRINALFLGGMLSMSSTTIIIKAFNDLGLTHRKFASLVFAVLIVEDLFAVLMMVVLSSIAIGDGLSGTDLILSISKLGFFLIMWFAVGVYVLPSLLNTIRRFLNSETLLVVSMGLCLGMAVFSVYCGFSLALGAFVMGSILAGTSFAERIEHVTAPVKDLFGAVFFISVGMMVNPTVISGYWMPILILSATVIIGMIIFGTFGMLVTGQTLKVAIESGFSLTQIGEFAFIIASLGMSLGVLDATVYPIVVAVSVLTTFTTPYFIRLSGPAYKFTAAHLPRRLHFLIDRYSDDATSDASQSGLVWRSLIRRYTWRILLYSSVLIAISLLSTRWLLPTLAAMSTGWGRLICALITLAAMAPFLMALSYPTSRRKEREILLKANARADVPLVVMTFFRLLLSLAFLVGILTAIFSWGVGVTCGVTLFIIMVFIFSKQLRRRMRHIEDRFLNNLNERELRRSGRNNNLIANLHLAYITVGYGCPFVGQRLQDSGLRTNHGVSVAYIQRSNTLIPVPGPDTRIFPADTIGIIGTDEAIQSLIPVIESQSAANDKTTDIKPADFRFTSVRLSSQSPLAGLTVAQSQLSTRHSALLVSILRDDEHLQPTPDTTLLPNDTLWLVAPPHTLTAIR